MKFNNRNVFVSPTAQLGHNVRIGDNTIIYDGVRIGDGVTIANDCVIGEPLNAYYHSQDYQQPETVIGAGSLIRSHTIIYAGNRIGAEFSCGHRVTIRESCRIGDHCAIGTLSDLQGYLEMGDYCRLHSNVHIGQKTKLGRFVFVYPYSVFTNDPKPPSEELAGAVVGDFSQIAVQCTILPGAVIGQHCLVGANSVCGGSIADYSLAIGSPAKVVKDVRELMNKATGKPLYPWGQRFQRGMPWAGKNFDEWMAAEYAAGK